MPAKKYATLSEMPADIQLQYLWSMSARQGRFRRLPAQSDFRPAGRYLGLADLCAVICWLFVFALAIVAIAWMSF